MSEQTAEPVVSLANPSPVGGTVAPVCRQWALLHLCLLLCLRWMILPVPLQNFLHPRTFLAGIGSVSDFGFCCFSSCRLPLLFRSGCLIRLFFFAADTAM